MFETMDTTNLSNNIKLYAKLPLVPKNSSRTILLQARYPLRDKWA